MIDKAVLKTLDERAICRPTYSQSGSGVLGSVGWIGSGWNGLVYLCACACTRNARAAACLGDTGHGWQSGILWQHFVLRLPGWLGLALFCGDRLLTALGASAPSSLPSFAIPYLHF